MLVADGALLNLLSNTLLLDLNAEVITFWVGKVKRQGHSQEHETWVWYISTGGGYGS